ncbi:peroxiredoxin [Longilinea arvoryzae]|uniref:Peroxiredoxin n=1 Tax=Longilinea arvoryzae TaxID=360412 RepID=A0A0S7BEV6_9CHLR|nr:TlpA disulfide reductase family protein [Longilinea arvoryzae]GAP14009.1 peroxiredoxin [Longilinea arvoryzae]
MDTNVENPQETQPSPRRNLPRWVILLSFTVLLAFLALIGIGLRRVQAGPIVIGQKVPDFSMVTFDGQTHDLSDFKGKVVVLNFWASWCAPCSQEAAELEQAWQYYKPGNEVIFLGVDYTDTEPEALSYLAKYSISYPNAPDLRTIISQMFRITGVPETYFIDRDGNLAYVKKGPFASMTEIQAAIDDLLK